MTPQNFSATFLALLLLLLAPPPALTSSRSSTTIGIFVLIASFTPIANADSYQVVFEEVGSVATSVSYLHIAVDMKLPALRQAISDYHTTSENAFKAVPLNCNLKRIFLDRLPAKEYGTLNANSPTLKIWEPIFKEFQLGLQSLRAQFATRARVFLNRFDHLTSILPHSATVDPNTYVPDDVRFKRSLRRTRRHSLRRSLRQKRYVPLVIAKGMVGTFMGLYSRRKLKLLKRELNSVVIGQKRLLVTQASLADKLQTLNASYSYLPDIVKELQLIAPVKLLVRLMEIELHIETELSKLTSAVQTAQMRRLSITLLSGERLSQALDRAKARASSLQLDLLIEHPSDLFQIETSYFFDGSEVSLLLHVPMAAPKSVLRLLRFHPFPLSFTDKYFLLPNPSRKLYAISSSEPRLSAELDESDLEGCYRISSMHLCERLGVLHRRTDRLCLGALYSQNFELALQLCDMDVVSASERVLQMSDNRYLVYATRAKTATVMCRNHTSSEYHLKVGVNRLRVSPSCYVELQDYVIFADSALSAENQIREIVWDPAELQMDANDLADAEASMADAVEEGLTSSTLADVRRRTGNRRRWIRWPYVLALAILILIAGSIAWAYLWLSSHKFWLLKQSVTVIHDHLADAVRRFTSRAARSVNDALHPLHPSSAPADPIAPLPLPNLGLPPQPPDGLSADSGHHSLVATAPREIVPVSPPPRRRELLYNAVDEPPRRSGRVVPRSAVRFFTFGRRTIRLGPQEVARFLNRHGTLTLEPLR